MSEYTKGPWKVFNSIDIFPDDDDKTASRHIADCAPMDYRDTDAMSTEEMKANAHLISAAPDYDEAACEFIEAWEDGGCTDELKEIYFKFVSAKAKARGKE